MAQDGGHRFKMWIKVYVGALTLIILTAKGASFTIKMEHTDWANAPCTLATPRLKYSIDKYWEVDEPQLKIPPDGLWIGYVDGTVAFDYLGCSSKCIEDTTYVRSIGDCHLMCKGKEFGIQKSDSKGSLRCCCDYNKEYLLETSCDNKCGHYETFLCGNEKTNFFSAYNSTYVETAQTSDESAVCLTFKFPIFTWLTCTDNIAKRLLCSSLKDGQRFAEVQNDKYRQSWLEANKECFSNTKYPATADSIRTKSWVGSDDQVHWTGVIRTHSVLNTENKDLITSSSIKYAFIKYGGRIAYESLGNRSSLCEELDDLGAEHSQKKGLVGAVVGVSVGILVAAVGGVVIVCLKRRGKLTCSKTKTLNNANDKHVLEGRSLNVDQSENSVANHNYFVLEKHTISEQEHIDHYHKPGETNEAIVNEDDYHSINDTGDPRGDAKGACHDYDYTTNKAAASGRRNPDTVYNKLKLDRQGDYDHVKGQGQINSITTNSDNDTTGTSRVRGAHGIGDYDHVQRLGKMQIAASINDYDTTASALAANGRRQDERVDGSNYNHILTSVI